MSDPTRLGDPRSTSPASLKRLIQAGRSDLPDDHRLRSLAGQLGFGSGAAAAGAGALKGAAAGMGIGATKIGAVVVLALGAAAGTLVTRELTRTTRPVVTTPSVTAPSPPELRPHPAVAASGRLNGEQSPPPGGQTPLAVPASVPHGASLHAAIPSAPYAARTAPGDGPLAAAAATDIVAPPGARQAAGDPASQPDEPSTDTEFSLLEQAQRALRSDPQRALELTVRDAKRHPSGALAQEREVIAIEALAKLGRIDEARARARVFFQAFPGSAHGPRVAALLGLDAEVHNP